MRYAFFCISCWGRINIMAIQHRTTKESILSCLELLKNKGIINSGKYNELVGDVEQDSIKAYQEVSNLLESVLTDDVDKNDRTC